MGERRAKQRKGGPNEFMNELERWANFYLLMSAAAATLLGLMFVIITLGAERSVKDGTAKIRMYLTPTVVYFASVLYLAALLTFPNHTRLTASLCTCLVGVAGLVYSGSFLIGRGGKKNYYGLQDRIVYAVVPFAAYGLHVFGGVLFFHAPNADSPWWLPVCCRCLRSPFATRGPSPSMSSPPLVGSKIQSSPLPAMLDKASGPLQ